MALAVLRDYELEYLWAFTEAQERGITVAFRFWRSFSRDDTHYCSCKGLYVRMYLLLPISTVKITWSGMLFMF